MLRAEANEQWEVVKECQLVAESAWRQDKAWLQVLKQKVLKLKGVTKRVWVAKNYPDLSKETSSAAEGELEAEHFVNRGVVESTE